MSRSKQETLLLEERIEKIRKKNEEIKKRHLEVEADKQNAAKLNALVQISSPSEDWPIGGRSSSPPPPASRRPRRLEPNKSQHSSNGNGGVAKCYTFAQGDGPPPDPKYKFLADAERDSDRRQFRPHRGRGSARGTPNRERLHRGGAGDSEPAQPEYEAWRAERNRIDNDRINRQKTAEGHWRREWDNEKITQEEDARPAGRGLRSAGPYRSNMKNQEFNQNNNTIIENMGSSSARVTERGRASGTPRASRGNLRGRRFVPVSILEKPDKSEESTPQNDRSIVSVGESIKISIPNDSSTPSMRRVKVNPPVVGGSGRVGPRQKIRVNYSSQSEDEAPYTRTVEIQPKLVTNLTSGLTSPSHSPASPVSKPPLPPCTGQKIETPKPRRQRTRRLEQDIKMWTRSDRIGNDDSDTAEGKSLERGTESGGDDSWEDVTTTSGTESACEEMSPRDDVAKLNEMNLTMTEKHRTMTAGSDTVLSNEDLATDCEEQKITYEPSSENNVADHDSEANELKQAAEVDSQAVQLEDPVTEVDSEIKEQEVAANDCNHRGSNTESLVADSSSDATKSETISISGSEASSSNTLVADDSSKLNELDNVITETIVSEDNSENPIVDTSSETIDLESTVTDASSEQKTVENPDAKAENLDCVVTDMNCNEKISVDSVSSTENEEPKDTPVCNGSE